MSTPRRAFIFDLDGVLTDTAHLHFIAWQHLAKSLDIAFDETFNQQLKGVGRMESLELILAKSGRTYTTEQKLSLAESKNNIYVGLIDGIRPADLLPGAMQALLRVRQAGCLVGLASASKNAFAVLDRLGITPMFDHIVDAKTVERSKPDPEVFLKAAAALGCQPQHCVGIEDAAAGVLAIKSAGMYAVGIGTAFELSLADTILPDLTRFDPQSYIPYV